MLILLMRKLRLRKAKYLLPHHIASKQQLDPICLILNALSFLLFSFLLMGKRGSKIKKIKNPNQVKILMAQLETQESQSSNQVKTRKPEVK